jgi:deoxyribodipyrimidine photo-lyase
MTAICWLRRDLRLTDHAALCEATNRSDRVLPVFVFDTTILGALPSRYDRRVDFIHRSLEELDGRLRRLGSKLHVLHGDPVKEIPAFAENVSAKVVVAARDYEPSAIDRDRRVASSLADSGRGFETVKDQVVLEAGEVLSQAGQPIRVFTPFSKAWLAQFKPEYVEPRTPVQPSLSATEGHDLQSIESYGFQITDLDEPVGEAGGLARLKAFEQRIDRYGEERDFPALHSTSGISIHLRFGTVSVREAFRVALAQDTPGARKWMSELIWREFYSHILAHFPHVVDRSFQPQYDAIEWPGNPEHFEVWREGRTGYPLVDAAMRHFQATGRMHNRLRMVVASFLVKDLLLDWRLGERYFAENLLDYDLASNNGGWQWAASTGCDPQPYFRIFNPILQSRKFDPNGSFIRLHCPELAGFDDSLIHWPHEASMFDQMEAGCRIGTDYPHPIVDHAVQKQIALRLLESVKGG